MQTPEVKSKIPCAVTEPAVPRLPPPPPTCKAPPAEMPPPISLTARERDVIRRYQARYSAASQALAEAEEALGSICAIIVERAGGNLDFRYIIAPDVTAMIPKQPPAKEGEESERWAEAQSARTHPAGEV
jgi:hypothetical protein